MKFKKLFLDESIMDEFSADNAVNVLVNHTPNFDMYDDDFSAPDYVPHVEDVVVSEKDHGVSSMIISSINDEWNTISTYNSIIATLREFSVENSSYQSFIDVVNDIVAEENKHVGQLQEILKKVSPNTSYIEKGEAEGRSQLRMIDGKLPVQSWTNSNVPASNEVDEICMLTDVDDEMWGISKWKDVKLMSQLKILNVW